MYEEVTEAAKNGELTCLDASEWLLYSEVLDMNEDYRSKLQQDWIGMREDETLATLKAFKFQIRGIDFACPKKQQKYMRLRRYLDVLIEMIEGAKTNG